MKIAVDLASGSAANIEAYYRTVGVVAGLNEAIRLLEEIEKVD